MSMPKELSFKDGKLIQTPIEELKTLRVNETIYTINEFEDVNVNDTLYEMRVDFESNEAFNLEIRKNVFLEFKDHLLTLTLNESGSGRSARHLEIDEVKNITVFSDTSCLEVFINDGEEVFTTRVYSETVSKPRFKTKNTGEIHYYPLKGYEYSSL